MKNSFLVFLIAVSSWATAQTIDSVHVSYDGQFLKTYIKGELVDPFYPHGVRTPTNRAIYSINYEFQGTDTIHVNFNYFQCSVDCGFFPYDTLAVRKMALSPGSKVVYLRSLDTIQPNCNEPIDTGTTKLRIINVPLSNNKTEKLTQVIKVFPNPTSNLLFIQPKDATELKALKLFDLNGKLVLKSEQNVNQLNLSSLTQGVYILEVFSDGGAERIKIYKE